MRNTTQRIFDCDGVHRTAVSGTRSEQAAGPVSHPDGARQYIEQMALELSVMAQQQDAGFLAYLLGLAAVEARLTKPKEACHG